MCIFFDLSFILRFHCTVLLRADYMWPLIASFMSCYRTVLCGGYCLCLNLFIEFTVIPFNIHSPFTLILVLEMGYIIILRKGDY